MKRPSLWGSGDLNAFFGLALDNLSNLVVLAAALIGVFGLPRDVVLGRMIPGSAVGVLLGDGVFTWMGARLARRRGRAVTAMPLGFDTPSLFGMAFLVVGPTYAATRDAEEAWRVGMATVVLMGLFKTAAAFVGPWLRRAVPRAALLGSIAGLALLLIAFLPTLKIFASPLVGELSLAIVLATLVARRGLPWGIPGALAAVAAATLAALALASAGVPLFPLGAEGGAAQSFSGVPIRFPWPGLAFVGGLRGALHFLPIAVPFALATVVGGVDVTESAAAAGDDFSTRDILLTEGVATLLAGMCGGVVQTTPYIGHPAYKAMGGKTGYTLGTALFIGGGGMTGALSWAVGAVPEAAVAPILLFIGLEITAQAFEASPPPHAPAVAIAFLPSIAALVQILLGGVLAGAGVEAGSLRGNARDQVAAVEILANGFIFTSLLWSTAVVRVTEGRFQGAALTLGVAALLTLFGGIHSVAPGGRLFLPWAPPSSIPFHLAGGYAAMASVFALLSLRPGAGLRAGPHGSRVAGSSKEEGT